MGTTIGIGNYIGNKVISQWNPQKITSKLLFWGKVSDIVGGEMPNLVTGATDHIDVAGSPATYTVPNTASYIAADTDYIWFNSPTSQRTTTTSELIGYDFSRTIVKYDDLNPYTIREIAILKSGEVLTTAEENAMRDYFALSIWWSGVLSLYGNVKGNRGVSRSVWTNVMVTLLDGHTKAWWKPSDSNYVTAAVGVESIYWDLLYGKLGALGAEQNSGVIIQYAVYKITATQVNFFYAGCSVGDVFACNVVKTCDANNKVQRYTGNHLTQPVATNQPTNQVFDGSDNFMKTAPFTLAQPYRIFARVKVITNTANKDIWDGNTLNSGVLQITTPSPDIRAYAGSFSSSNGNLANNTWGVVRLLFNHDVAGASKLQVDATASVDGDFGVTDPGGFTLGCAGNGVTAYSNIQVDEIFIRDQVDSAGDEAALYSYIAS